MTYSIFDFVRRGPSFSNQAAEQLNCFEIHAATAFMPRAPTAAHAMLSLSEVPCCESSVMKAWLNCHPRERAGERRRRHWFHCASIFDVSMVGGGGHRARFWLLGEGGKGECPKKESVRIVQRAAPRSQRYARIFLDTSRSRQPALPPLGPAEDPFPDFSSPYGRFPPGEDVLGPLGAAQRTCCP